MRQTEENKELKLHPIQLLSVTTKELYIHANITPTVDVGAVDNKFVLATGSSDYDEETCQIIVGVKVEVGLDEKDESPFSMRIEIVGEFKVDEDQFPKEHISDWAQRNAPFILMPYVREQAFALTARCGYQPMLIPLTQVPTFSINK